MTQISPLAEASANSLDEYFSRKPPYDADTLTRIKLEFRRLRTIWEKDEQEGKRSKAKKAKASSAKGPQEITDDIFGGE